MDELQLFNTELAVLRAENDSLRAQLAAAQRVPEDDELDALASRNPLDPTALPAALAAITALRRRVADLAAALSNVLAVYHGPLDASVNEHGQHSPRYEAHKRAAFLLAAARKGAADE